MIEFNFSKEKVKELAKKLTEGGFESHFRVGFLLGEINGGIVIVEDIIVFGQQSSCVKTEIDINSMAKILVNNREAIVSKVVAMGVYYPDGFSLEDSMVNRQRRFNTSGSVDIVFNSQGNFKVYGLEENVLLID
jgi:hypothetical protein